MNNDDNDDCGSFPIYLGVGYGDDCNDPDYCFNDFNDGGDCESS